jgi:3-deoxy-7-phosphoheptulonate synthase
MNSEGRIASIKTQGNRLAHLILRGSENKANFDADSVGEALSLLQKYDLPLSLMIDCSHGNSQKDPKKQRVALESVIAQVCGGNKAISGFMLESHIHRGNQSFFLDRSQIRYGVSITDPCSGWEETESLLLSASEQLISINSVQS